MPSGTDIAAVARMTMRLPRMPARKPVRSGLEVEL